jgi:chromosome segregation ATPase
MEVLAKDQHLASAAATISSRDELLACLKKQLDELHISECSAREIVRIEIESASSKVKAAEDFVQQMQNECCAALKAAAESEACAAAQAKSNFSALKAAEAQALHREGIVSTLRKEVEELEHVKSRLDSETNSRMALERKLADAEAFASTSASSAANKLSTLNEEIQLIQSQLQLATQNANSSAQAKDALQVEIGKLTSQLHEIQRENSAKEAAVQRECNSLKGQLAQASGRLEEYIAVEASLSSQLTKSLFDVVQEKQENARLRSALEESNSQIIQLNEHIGELRAHIAHAAHARTVQIEDIAVLSDELAAMRNEKLQMQAALSTSALDQATISQLHFQIRRLEEDKLTLERHVETLMDAARVALASEISRHAVQPEGQPSRATAQQSQQEFEDLRVRHDEAVEATASLSTQADDLSLENAALKAQVSALKDEVFFIKFQWNIIALTVEHLLQIIQLASSKASAENCLIEHSTKLKVAFPFILL